ncbi:hypothetical protein M0L63_RS14860 [Providencia rettgeri]|uniref:Uncharacterized protein n=1 Tax=Providencia rettgeri TaxID=587 RepID=A0AAW6USS3_PRORE|nr:MULTISPECIES: hypothetical protein [Providencia]EJD6583982.1 hypothetical protein [Providencia rettgeri]ELR5224768.1 hypothetical protein [Providencia rettgeri]ELR5251647.1 hypothetical protein [Providencia rettgeri]MCY0801207.1 hypothetical protein [Providencia rettgeri]MDI9095703.1 hypothetical protein [Providencia rettgeri]
MITEQDMTYKFDTKAATPGDVNKEISALKFIICCVVNKLDESSREHLVKELSTINDPVVENMVENFKLSLRR